MSTVGGGGPRARPSKAEAVSPLGTGPARPTPVGTEQARPTPVGTEQARPTPVGTEQARPTPVGSHGFVDRSGTGLFDDWAAIAAHLCGAPLALVCLAQTEQPQPNAGAHVLSDMEERMVTFASDALGGHPICVVPDALADPLFVEDPLVTGPPCLRACAGVQLTSREGDPVGALFVLDVVARIFTDEQLEHLTALGRRITGQLGVDRLESQLALDSDALRASVADMARLQGMLSRSEQRWHLLFDLSPVGVGLAGEDGRYVAVNDALCELLGRQASEMIGQSAAELVLLANPSSPQPTQPTGSTQPTGHTQPTGPTAQLPQGRPVHIERRYVRPGGEERWAWVTITKVPGPSGQRWTLAQVQDVTDRRADEQVVLDFAANLSAVATVVKQIQSGADARQSIVDAALHLAGAAHASLIEPCPGNADLKITASTDPTLRGLIVPLDGSSAASTAFTSSEPYFLPNTADHPFASARMLAIQGAVYVVPVWSGDLAAGVLSVDWAEQVSNLDDRRAAVVTLLADQAGVALRQAKLISDLEALALTDALTRLPNRRSWDQLLALLLALARRRGRAITVALADLDHFKRYNDSHGHPAGDALLKGFAVAGRMAIREGDTLSRWGGEEFAVVLPDCSETEALGVLDRVRNAVPGQQTCSIGYATWDGRESAAALMARADRAMYSAKRGGRNRIVAASPEPAKDLLHRR